MFFSSRLLRVKWRFPPDQKFRLKVSGIPYNEYRTVFSGIWGQPREVDPTWNSGKFPFHALPRSQFHLWYSLTFSRRMSVPFAPVTKFSEFLVEWKAPKSSKLSTFMIGRCQVFCQYVTKRVTWYPSCVVNENTLISAIRRVNRWFTYEIFGWTLYQLCTRV